jgi:hypothetical protein
MHYSTTEFVVSSYIAAQVKTLLEGRCRELDFSYTVPATLKQTCVFCGQDGLFPCSDGADFFYLATVEVAPDGQRRAELTRPHRCAELQRHQEFMDSSEEEEL